VEKNSRTDVLISLKIKSEFERRKEKANASLLCTYSPPGGGRAIALTGWF
jgi:hypothetical protein